MTERLENLKFHVHKVALDQIESSFPSLFKYAEFKDFMRQKEPKPPKKKEGQKEVKAKPNHLFFSPEDRPKVVKYIILLYDKGSDLNEEYPDKLKQRKEAAMLEAGFTWTAGGKWDQKIQAVMDIKNPMTKAMAMRYLKIQNYPVWTDIVVTTQELDEFLELRFQPVDKDNALDDAKKKTVLMEACEVRRQALSKLQKQFYDDHSDLKEDKDLEMITPENNQRILEIA